MRGKGSTGRLLLGLVLAFVAAGKPQALAPVATAASHASRPLAAAAIQAPDPLMTAALQPPGPLAAAAPPGVLQRAQVGEWVTYQLDGGGGRRGFLRLAVVADAQDAQGRPAVWLELELGTDGRMLAPLATLSVLASRAEGLGPGGITRLVVGAGTGQPQEVDPAAFSRLLPLPLGAGPSTVASGAAPPGTRLVPVDREQDTPVGKRVVRCFETRVGAVTVHAVCTHPEVPLLGIVSLTLPQLGQSLRWYASGVAASRRMPSAADRPSIGQER